MRLGFGLQQASSTLTKGQRTGSFATRHYGVRGNSYVRRYCKVRRDGMCRRTIIREDYHRETKLRMGLEGGAG